MSGSEAYVIKMLEAGLEPTGPAARVMLESLGVSCETIDSVFAAFDKLIGELL